MRPNLTAMIALAAIASVEDAMRGATSGPPPRVHRPSPDELSEMQENARRYAAQKKAEDDAIREKFRAERRARKAANFAKRQPKGSKG